MCQYTLKYCERCTKDENEDNEDYVNEIVPDTSCDPTDPNQPICDPTDDNTKRVKHDCLRHSDPDLTDGESSEDYSVATEEDVFTELDASNPQDSGGPFDIEHMEEIGAEIFMDHDVSY